MKRTLLAGMLVLTTGLPVLVAQKAANGTQAPAEAGPKPKSKGEAQAIQAMFAAATNPDNEIAAAEDLVTKYADTDFKDVAYFLEATAYQRKGDLEKAQVYAERAVTANPKNFQAALMLAELITQHTRENDLDRDQKLAKAKGYADQAIDTLNASAKPNPQMSDQQWADAKKDMIAEAHESLGMGALVSKNYALAITELKAADDGAAHPQPAFKVRLASAYSGAGKYDESIAMAESVMNDAQAPQVVKQVAQAVRAGAVVAKNKASGQPATPAAPAGQTAPATPAPKP